jgi:periplasmic divalent cation tolerance protein
MLRLEEALLVFLCMEDKIMASQYAVVLTTCSNEDDAKKIIASLLEKKLAACIQTYPVNSFYSWKGSLCHDNEILLLIKCKYGLFDSIKADILENHPYEIPEIILLPISDGYGKYLSWIDEVSKQ